MHAKDDNDDDDDDDNEKHIQNFLSVRELIVQSEPFSFKTELQGEAQTQKSKVNEHRAYTHTPHTRAFEHILYGVSQFHTVHRILCVH